jgi:hypothetical protein
MDIEIDKPKHKSKHLSRLSNGLYFTENDLEVNAQGEISDFQAGRLRTRLIMRLVAIGAFGLFVLFILSLFPAYSVTSTGFGSSMTGIVSVNPIIGFIAPMLWLGLIVGGGLVIWRSLGIVRDLRARRAESVEGRVQLDMHHTYNRSMHQVGGNHYRMTGGRSHYYVYIGGMRFEVSKAGFLAFKNDDPYIVYYAPHSRMLLSAEWLRDNDPFE